MSESVAASPAPLFPVHEALLAALLAKHQQGLLPHALLVSAPQGYGADGFVQGFSHGLLCDAVHAGQATVACGLCSSCRLWRGGNHPDYLVLQPEAHKQGISIEQVRQLQERLLRPSHRGRGLVAAVMPAEALGVSSFNALLKSLEEPLPGVTWVLVSQRLRSLPATVRSRCQIVRLPPPNSEKHPYWGQLPPEWSAGHWPVEAGEALATDWAKRLLAIENQQVSALGHSLNKEQVGWWTELLYRQAHHAACLALSQGQDLNAALHRADIALQARQSLWAHNVQAQWVIDEAMLSWSDAA